MQRQGFTLIELSIVLVIIGLIVGGILVGQDLIKAAEVRAQLSQIEKYNTAVNTFKGKFGGLPGDLSATLANQYGFTLGINCTGTYGFRDGNGQVGNWPGINLVEGAGETQLFWDDISSDVAGNLIDGKFPNSTAQTITCNGGGGVTMNTTTGTTYLGDFLPAAKIGHSNYVYVYPDSAYNWFGVSGVTAADTNGNMFATPNIPVIQAYNMDKKVDDGVPTSGSVQPNFINNSTWVLRTANAQATDSTTSCYNTTTSVYSIGSLANYGANGNCALSFRFQ